MRVSMLRKAISGFTHEVVNTSVEVVVEGRPKLVVHVRPRVRRRGGCGRCGELASCFGNGDGARRWRHLDAGYATVELVAVARRVDCAGCGISVIGRLGRVPSRELPPLRPSLVCFS